MLRRLFEFLLSWLLLSIYVLAIAAQVAWDEFWFLLLDFPSLAIQFISSRRVDIAPTLVYHRLNLVL